MVGGAPSSPCVASRFRIARTTAGDQWKADLNHSFYRKRYWFTGKEFLEWVAKWFGREIAKGFAFQKVVIIMVMTMGLALRRERAMNLYKRRGSPYWWTSHDTGGESRHNALT